MNKIERMRTVIKGELPDRIPASFWFHLPKDQAHVNGNPQEIKAEVHKIIRTVGPRNLILGADCTLPTDINIDHIRTAIEAAAAYPLRNNDPESSIS